MKNNIVNLLKFIPKWKLVLYVLLSLGVAVTITAVILPAVWYLEEDSRFFESLFFILSYVRELFMIAFYMLIMSGCFILIYQYERKRYLLFHLNNVTEKVNQIDAERFTYDDAFIQPEFEKLVYGIRHILTTAEAAKNELKQADQFKHELVTNVAHDLRSPLTSITGYLDLIHHDKYRDEVELRHYVQVIHENAFNLQVLINDIFDFTYIQNQQVTLQTAMINIEEMLNQLAIQTKVQLSDVEMEIRLKSEAKQPIVEGDGMKLVRVFENIIQNAIRYGSDGRYLDLFIRDTDKSVTVEIVNYGQDFIPPSDLPFIFERFYRVEKSRSQFTGGSGLGLAITKSIVDLHGGNIGVSSHPGKTAFEVTLNKPG